MKDNRIKIDLTYLYSITGGDKSFQKVLLSGTVADVDQMIHDLEKCWQQNNSFGVRKNAHSLISLSAIAGMPEVEEWCRKIDQAFADGVFHPELNVLANNIITGWPGAKSELGLLIGAN